MLHENLKALRKQKGLTQEELAIRLNVVRQTVSKWESGRSVPDADILLKIADVLDVSISDLLGAALPNDETQQNEIAAQLTRLLGSRNLGVIRLEERQKSLEDIFLELTGKAASL